MIRYLRLLLVIVILSTVLLSSSLAAKKVDLSSIPDVPRDKVICFALYTVNNGTMKMTAQLYPLKDAEEKVVRLEIKKAGKWIEIAKSDVITKGWTAHFRVENWDYTKDIEYRLVHGEKAYYSGLPDILFRRESLQLQEIS